MVTLKNVEKNGTCLNDDGINPLININQRSTWDGKNYGFVRTGSYWSF